MDYVHAYTLYNLPQTDIIMVIVKIMFWAHSWLGNIVGNAEIASVGGGGGK